MAVTVTNRTVASALKGEGVQVTLDSTDQSKLQYLTTGQLCQCITSLKTGYISFVDYRGNTFQVKPLSPATSFDNGTPGELAVGDIINITTP